MEEEKPEYKKYLVEFMSFRDAQVYNLETVFPQEERAAITPAEIERCMCQKVEIQQLDTGERCACRILTQRSQLRCVSAVRANTH